MAVVPEPRELTAAQAAAAIRDGSLTSERLVRSCMERIDARDGQLQAWAHLDPDRVLGEARAADAAEPRGALHGVPVGIKDIVDTVDLPTEYGSPVYAGHRSGADALCVARLRAAGAVVMGKTTTTEFALLEPAPTRNPHDLTRTPGGSSSGSAAAVADRMVPLALATQTAGSIVRPAAFCGIFGLKPTFGTLPLDGVKPVAPSLDTLGMVARSVEDLELALAVMAGAGTPEDPLPGLPARPRVGLLRTPWWEATDPEARREIERAADALAGTAVVSDLELPEECAGLVEAQEDLMAAELATALGPEYRDHAELLSEDLRQRIARGRTVPAADVDRAARLAERCRPLVDEALAPFDAVLAPAVLGEPPDAATTGDPLLCRPWTLLGTPCVAVPGLQGPAGLPLGVQVVAPRGRDRAALAAAAWLADGLASSIDLGSGSAVPDPGR